MPDDPINASKKAVPRVNLRRRVVNAAVTFAAVGSVILVLTPLVAVFGYLVYRGIGSVNWAFLTQTPKPVGEAGGGMANAIAGSAFILLIASVIGVPFGIGAGVYLAEYGQNRFGDVIRFTADVLNGVPSIVIGIVAYGIVVLAQGHFSALAGEQVRLHINNQTSTGLLYTLTGPDGFVGFTNLGGDSPFVNLTQTGAYTLNVQGLNGATGNYSFVVNPTTQTSIPLNGSINGTLIGSRQAELYTINVPAAQSLTVSLDDQSAADSNEMYLRFGAPPTRGTATPPGTRHSPRRRTRRARQHRTPVPRARRQDEPAPEGTREYEAREGGPDRPSALNPAAVAG